jgi:outer membrane immunogenic protein
MSRLHRNLTGLSFVSAIALAPLAASAADLYRNSSPSASYAPPAAYVEGNIWQGFYAGLNGGYGGNGDGGAISYSNGDSSARAQPEGGFGGGQIGYNFQGGPLVFGLETDFQGGDLSRGIAGTTAGGAAFSSKETVDWFGTARGRLGLAFGHALFYGTGGFAYGDVRQSAVYNGISLGASGTQTGWVAGGGVEYKFTPAWSLKGEYQYIDLGSEKLMDAANVPATNNLDTSFQTVRLGLNYRFGGSADPLK